LLLNAGCGADRSRHRLAGLGRSLADQRRTTNQPAKQKVGLAMLLVCRIAVACWTGWHFQHNIALSAGRECPAEGMDDAGRGLLTDKGRIVPVFHARITATWLAMPNTAKRLRQPTHRALADDYRSNCHGWIFTAGSPP
jgi:hypothetical protein